MRDLVREAVGKQQRVQSLQPGRAGGGGSTWSELRAFWGGCVPLISQGAADRFLAEQNQVRPRRSACKGGRADTQSHVQETAAPDPRNCKGSLGEPGSLVFLMCVSCVRSCFGHFQTLPPECQKEKSFGCPSSCVAWLRRRPGRLARVKAGRSLPLPQTELVLSPCLGMVSRARAHFVGRSCLWRVAGTVLPATPSHAAGLEGRRWPPASRI